MFIWEWNFHAPNVIMKQAPLIFCEFMSVQNTSDVYIMFKIRYLNKHIVFIRDDILQCQWWSIWQKVDQSPTYVWTMSQRWKNSRGIYWYTFCLLRDWWWWWWWWFLCSNEKDNIYDFYDGFQARIDGEKAKKKELARKRAEGEVSCTIHDFFSIIMKNMVVVSCDHDFSDIIVDDCGDRDDQFSW